MQRRTLFTVLTMMALILMAVGCKKDDDKILNKLTLAGNATTEYNGVYTPDDGHYNGPNALQCVNTRYGSYIWIDLSPSAVLQIQMTMISNAVALPEGTMSPSPGECEVGFYAVFYPDYGAKDGGLWLSSGTVTIKKEGSEYSVDVNLSVDDGSGGGTLKGNFYGALPFEINGVK